MTLRRVRYSVVIGLGYLSGLRSLFGAGVSGTEIMLSATRAGGVFLVALALLGMMLRPRWLLTLCP
jgi:hypothetical protein